MDAQIAQQRCKRSRGSGSATVIRVTIALLIFAAIAVALLFLIPIFGKSPSAGGEWPAHEASEPGFSTKF